MVFVSILVGPEGVVYQWSGNAGHFFEPRGNIEGETNVVLYHNEDLSDIPDKMRNSFDLLIAYDDYAKDDIEKKRIKVENVAKEWLAPDGEIAVPF